jgi:hypothetical protein
MRPVRSQPQAPPSTCQEESERSAAQHTIAVLGMVVLVGMGEHIQAVTAGVHDDGYGQAFPSAF